MRFSKDISIAKKLWFAETYELNELQVILCNL